MLQQLSQNQTIPFTEQYQLSLLRRSDLIAICEMLNDDKVNQYLYFAPAADSFFYDYFMPLFEQAEQAVAAGKLPSPLMVAVRDQNDQFVGMAALVARADQPGHFDVGYQLTAANWGKGLATKLCRQLVHWAFTDFAANSVHADTYDTNLGSKRVLEKSGLGRTVRDYGHFEGGIDRCWFSIDRAQWLRSTAVAA